MSKFSNETLNPGEHFIYNGVAPVCLFSSEKLKLCRQGHLIGVDENDAY